MNQKQHLLFMQKNIVRSSRLSAPPISKTKWRGWTPTECVRLIDADAAISIHCRDARSCDTLQRHRVCTTVSLWVHFTSAKHSFSLCECVSLTAVYTENICDEIWQCNIGQHTGTNLMQCACSKMNDWGKNTVWHRSPMTQQSGNHIRPHPYFSVVKW